MRKWPSAAWMALAVALVGRSVPAQETQIDPLRAAAKAAPGDANASLALGRALRRAGHEVAALEELRRGLTLPSGRAGDAAVALHYEIARSYIAKRDFGQAMVACKVIGALPAGAALGHACAAEAHLLWRRASEALGETAQALANGNKSYEAKVAEGLAHELEVKDAEAESSFRQAIQWRPDAPEAHIWLGRLLVRVLRHEEGVAELRRAAELDPHGPESLYELARVLPPNAEAEGLLARAVQERPAFGPALLRLANVELDLKKLPDARKAADAIVKAEPQEPAAHVVSGRVALAEGKPDDAIRAAQTALGIVPNSAAAKLLIGDAYADKGEVDLAVENYQSAYGMNHEDPTALVHASTACHAQGRDTTARAFGEKATKEFPSWGPGWVALGDALAGQREIGPARTAYQTALKSTGPVDAALVAQKIAQLK